MAFPFSCPPGATRDTSESTTEAQGPRRVRRAGWRQLVLLGVLYVAYTASRTLADGDLAPARRHTARLVDLERWLHVDLELWLNHLISGTRPLAVGASYWYAVLHYVVTPSVLISPYGRDADRYARARDALIATTAIGLAVYLAFPTAPPRLMPGGYVDTLAQVSQYGWWSSHASAPAGLGGLTNELAAMPSLHVGWAVWVTWIAWRSDRRGYQVAGVCYPVVTSLVVVGTGNHWLLDVLAGAAVATAGILATSPRLRSPHHGVRPKCSGWSTKVR
jgi:hypothetical protein